MRREEGRTGHNVGLSLQSPLPHKCWLERRDGPRCERQEAEKERIGGLRVCGAFPIQKPKISQNKPGKRSENADFSQPMLTGIGATAPSAEPTGRAGVVLPELQPGLKGKPKHQHQKLSNKYLPQTGRCNEASFVTRTEHCRNLCLWSSRRMLWFKFYTLLGGFFCVYLRMQTAALWTWFPSPYKMHIGFLLLMNYSN